MMPPSRNMRGGGGGGGGRHGHQQQQGSFPRSPVVERARAISALADVGEAAAMVTADAAGAAAEAVRNGEAFRESAYADSAEDFAVTPAAS